MKHPPPPSCPLGYTQADIVKFLGSEEYVRFVTWMAGQTQVICDGRTYVHCRAHNEKCGHGEGEPFTWQCGYPGGGHYEKTPCHEHTHGIVTYTWDFERYLAGLPVID